MKQNYSQRLEMQIPQENIYTGLEIIQKEDYDLEEFLNRNFEFPSDNLDDIKNFISVDEELEKIIYDLPEIVSKEFSESPISLDFTEYSLSDEDVMEIVIKTQFDGETTSHKKNLILDEIFTKYSKTTNEYYMSMEF